VGPRGIPAAESRNQLKGTRGFGREPPSKRGESLAFPSS
jgi:hypothetical protein